MPAKHRFRVRVGEDDLDVEVSIEDDGRARTTVADRNFEVLDVGDGIELVRADGETAHTAVTVSAEARPTGVTIHGISHPVEVQTAQAAAADAAVAAGRGGTANGTVAAPMPGRVVRVLVAEGEAVEVGAPVLIVEAMKMENELTAPIAGIVQDIGVSAGDTVDTDQLLCEIVAQAGST